MTIDKALVDLWREHQQHITADNLEELCFKRVDYLAKRDSLIWNWPNEVELITHPNRKLRWLFIEILKIKKENKAP